MITADKLVKRLAWREMIVAEQALTTGEPLALPEFFQREARYKSAVEDAVLLGVPGRAIDMHRRAIGKPLGFQNR